MNLANASSGNTRQLIKDPILSMALYNRHLPSYVIWLVTSILPITAFGFLALALGEFFPKDGKITFINDYNLFNGLLLGVPAVFLFYCLFPKYLQECFNQLQDNNVIGGIRFQGELNSEKCYDYNSFLDDVSESLSIKWLMISFVLSAIFMIIAIPEHLRSQSWIIQNKTSLIFIEIFWFFIFTVVVLLACRVIAGIWWINQAFKRFEIVVRPLYPDGVGGLQPLSQFALRLGLFVFVFGIELGTNQFTTHYVRTKVLGGMEWAPDIVIPWILYLIAAPIVFFAPLSAAHKGMKEAKKSELMILSNHFEKHYKKLKESLKNSPESIKRQSANLAEIRKLYKAVEVFPVWPFQLKKFFQFLITVVLPPLITLVSSIFGKYISKWLGN
jgi:hypothetical protein